MPRVSQGGTGASSSSRAFANLTAHLSPADGEVIQWDDTRGKWVAGTPPGGAPSGAAGGDLGGTYPNPTVDDDSHAHTSSTVTLSAADVGASAIGHSHVGLLALSTVEVDLGTAPVRSGSFVISGLSGLTVGREVLVTQAAATPTGKGEGEGEFDMVMAHGVVASSSTVQVYWQALPGPVSGNLKFNHIVSTT